MAAEDMRKELAITRHMSFGEKRAIGQRRDLGRSPRSRTMDLGIKLAITQRGDLGGELAIPQGGDLTRSSRSRSVEAW